MSSFTRVQEKKITSPRRRMSRSTRIKSSSTRRKRMSSRTRSNMSIRRTMGTSKKNDYQ